MNWYVIRTKPHQEKLVESQLRKCGIETLLPFLEENRIFRRHRKAVLGPLFPGYLFSRFDLKEHHRTVKYTRGTLGLVSFGSAPARVEEELIDTIRSRLLNGVLTIRSQCLMPGQTVQINSGPMDGVEAVFLYEMPGRQRAVVLLRSLAYQGRLVLPMEQVVNG